MSFPIVLAILLNVIYFCKGLFRPEDKCDYRTEEYVACGPGGCQPSCRPDPGPCTELCAQQCICRKGFIRAAGGRSACIREELCPAVPSRKDKQRSTFYRRSLQKKRKKNHENKRPVHKCDPRTEEYSACKGGGCQVSCRPGPERCDAPCPSAEPGSCAPACVPGCVCRPGYIRAAGAGSMCIREGLCPTIPFNVR